MTGTETNVQAICPPRRYPEIISRIGHRVRRVAIDPLDGQELTAVVDEQSDLEA